MRVGAVDFLEVQRWNVHFSDWASSVVLVGRVVKGGWFLRIGSLKVLSVKETSHPLLDRDRSLVLSISLLAMLVGLWFVVDCRGVLRRWPMLCRVVVRGVATRLKWFEIVGTLSLAIICRLVEWVYLQASALLLSGRRTYLRFKLFQRILDIGVLRRLVSAMVSQRVRLWWLELLPEDVYYLRFFIKWR